MPHLTERMRRLTKKDEAARKQARSERTPDLYAISRVKPLPMDPPPPRPATRSDESEMDKFLSSLTDEEAHFLARRRAKMLNRVAQLASSQRDTPPVPSAGRDMDAYLASLSDEEALVLARRREQELVVLQKKLRQLSQPRAAPAPAASMKAAFQKGTETGVTTLTHEEKLLLACHRAKKLSNGARANASPVAQEQARWERMKGAASLPNNAAASADSLIAALLARRQAQGAASVPNNIRRQGTSSLLDLRTGLLARAPRTPRAASLPFNSVRRGSGDSIPADFDAAILERARRAKVQADFLATVAGKNQLLRPSEHVSEPEETAILERARQAQIQSELLTPTSQRRQGRSDSISVVKAAMHTLSRAERLNGASTPQNLSLTSGRSTATMPPVETPRRLSSRPGSGPLSQRTPELSETRTNVAAIRESLLGSREDPSIMDIAKFLAMKGSST